MVSTCNLSLLLRRFISMTAFKMAITPFGYMRAIEYQVRCISAKLILMCNCFSSDKVASFFRLFGQSCSLRVNRISPLMLIYGFFANSLKSFSLKVISLSSLSPMLMCLFEHLFLELLSPVTLSFRFFMIV